MIDLPPDTIFDTKLMAKAMQCSPSSVWRMARDGLLVPAGNEFGGRRLRFRVGDQAPGVRQAMTLSVKSGSSSLPAAVAGRVERVVEDEANLAAIDVELRGLVKAFVADVSALLVRRILEMKDTPCPTSSESTPEQTGDMPSSDGLLSTGV